MEGVRGCMRVRNKKGPGVRGGGAPFDLLFAKGHPNQGPWHGPRMLSWLRSRSQVSVKQVLSYADKILRNQEPHDPPTM